MPHDSASPMSVRESEPSLMEEINARVTEMRELAREGGVDLRPPVLALGISERVGSNWFLDSLSHNVHTHNEPFRQQLHATHPLSTLVSRPDSTGQYHAHEMHPYESHWLTNFVLSKYSSNPQLLKETNLFFAVDNLLELFPDSKVLILARSPVGIASSFARNDLFRKWNYAERYNQLKAMTLQPQYEQYGFVFDGTHDPGSLRKLTRLVVLNTLLLSQALEERDHMIVRYEDSVISKKAVETAVGDFLDGTDIEFIRQDFIDEEHTDHVFSTRKNKVELAADLDQDDVAVIDNEMRRLLADSLSVLSVTQYEQAQSMLEPNNVRYKTMGRVATTATEVKPDTPVNRPEFGFVSIPETGLQWANQPVNNTDFVKFLNVMYQEGVPNLINGTQLFVNENMIPARGGRVWFNPNTSTYEVTPGYENHPLYWVTWLGAAAYARYSGARLPDREEFLSLIGNVEEINFSLLNCGHKFDDVNVPGTSPPSSEGIYDVLGNVASWCRDGYSEAQKAVANRYIFGTAWNREGSIEEVSKIKARPLVGCSRSVGIRLVQDQEKKLTGAELAERFDGWFKLMSRKKDVSATDRYIIDQLIY